MLFAYDYNDNRIFIDDTHSNQEYYCPFCGAPLITKKGNLRAHHFAHKSGHLCTDTWHKKYDLSEWHSKWQREFPKENQEVVVKLGNISHRADIMIDKTIVEFQHSLTASQVFDERNTFYRNFGFKVIWLFDLSELYASGKIREDTQQENGFIEFQWDNPKQPFNAYDVQNGTIDLFFQLRGEDAQSIVRVTDVSKKGFEFFTTTGYMDKQEFLNYVGLQNGNCLAPDNTNIQENEAYLKFKETYKIELNKQQEQAMLAVNGATLLLAVPGSGKTTVLVDKLGYMILQKGIAPDDILAITYNKEATEEMERRFRKKFGNDVISPKFQTINSLSYQIYLNYCNSIQRPLFKIIDDKCLHKLLQHIYKEHHKETYTVFTENDYVELQTAFSYIKNMYEDLYDSIKNSNSQIHKEINTDLLSMYKDYAKFMKSHSLMDFDDQMVFAYTILTKNPEVLKRWRKKYHYICVDEAQDTSRIQHKIIKLLTEGNNLFMVGDEDQSIYGFRGSYPKALLNFRFDYINPLIIKMDMNYRSTDQIVDTASKFINANTGRYNKIMKSVRGDGDEIGYYEAFDAEFQYQFLLDVAKTHTKETAFLFRNNESAVVLIDLFLRNNVPFMHIKPRMNFFECKVVKQVKAYLQLSVNPYDVNAFKTICNTGVLYLKNQIITHLCRNVNTTCNIFDALEKQKKYIKKDKWNSIELFAPFIRDISLLSPFAAILFICERGYENYVTNNGLDFGKLEILKILAKQEKSVGSFLKRLDFLEKECIRNYTNPNKDSVILSTIHSAKGKEYDTVYMVDIYDGCFPASQRDYLNFSKDKADNEQEERRLFYVGMTRAKNHLHFVKIKDRYSSYLDELFPNRKSIIELPVFYYIPPTTKTRYVETISDDIQPVFDTPVANSDAQPSSPVRQSKHGPHHLDTDWTQDPHYGEVKNQNFAQQKIIHDSTGRRWVICEKCGKIKPESEFYKLKTNFGICYICDENKG